jgi:hypothetical protein
VAVGVHVSAEVACLLLIPSPTVPQRNSIVCDTRSRAFLKAHSRSLVEKDLVMIESDTLVVAIRFSKAQIGVGVGLLLLCGVEGMRSMVDVVSALSRGDRARASRCRQDEAERTPA